MVQYTDLEISKQEALTPERLKLLSGGYILSSARPKESLVELMEFVKNCLNGVSNSKLAVFIHNKITMDGSFIKFCEERNLQIKAVHTDALTSWSSPQKDEHFLAIGIYKITSPDLSQFFVCGLFHKGNQNEDEVSFFVCVTLDEFEKYVAVRDDFVEWQNKRDRDVSEIEVIGGNSIPYSQELTWDDLYLDSEIKDQIIRSVGGFLSAKDVYKKMKVPWRRGLLFWGEKGNGKTSALRIIMSVYKELKPVTIQAGSNSPDELLEEAFQYASDHAPALLYFEDLQELIKTIEISHLLQLLDGIQRKEGILTIATGNNISKLEENITNRPRRFDRKFEFPFPSLDLSKKYLGKFFADILLESKIDAIAKKAIKSKFTYAHLQEIYFNSVTAAIQEGREKPTEAEVTRAFEEVLKDKKMVDDDFTNTRSLMDEKKKDYL